MKRDRMGWMLAISVGLALTLMTAACGTLVGPLAGAPAGFAPQYASPNAVPSTWASCDGGTAASAQAACGPPWLMPR